jgi:HAD superfamily hydrolase (TIGR01509 family)
MKDTNQSGIHAVIFDLDGLMICSEPVAFAVWQELVESLGGEFTAEEYRRLIGGTPEESARWILETKQLDIQYGELLERYWSMRTQTVIEQVGLEPGVRELLVNLRARELPLGVATNSRREYLVRVLAALDVRDFFSTVCSFDDVPQGKPAPDIYLVAALALNIDPERCLVFEDSPVGLEAALRAGMRCVVIPNQELREADFRGAYAKYASIVEAYEHLDALLA